MSIPDFLISANARAQILQIRRDQEAIDPEDPPAMLGIFWGGEAGANMQPIDFGNPAPVFWSRSQFPPTAREANEVSNVSGMELIFVAPKEFRPLFEGRTVDYADGGGFFLRDRRPEDEL